jgi:hypothetical protein
MEIEGFRRLMARSTSWPFSIATIATDRHIQIAKEMRENHDDIRHEFDVWHMAKSVSKQLSIRAKRKDCDKLSIWIPSISNHIWWASGTCGGNTDVLK